MVKFDNEMKVTKLKMKFIYNILFLISLGL